MATNDRGDHHPMRGMYGDDLIIEPLPYIAEDPYGLHKMPEMLRKYNPDLVFGLNDIWVWTGDDRHPELDNWFLRHLKEYKPYIPWVGYFPVDGRLWDQKWVNLINNMTYAAVFSDYGYKVLSETDNVNMSKVNTIYHGHDTQHFFPISEAERMKAKKMLGVPEDSFLVGCFPKDTPILMANSETKNIQDIKVGDKIINHKGEQDTVTDVMTRIYEGKMYHLEISGITEPLVATEEHPIYSAINLNVNKKLVLSNGEVLSTKLNVTQRLDKIDKQWTEIKNINVGDYVLTPIIKTINEIESIITEDISNKSSGKKLPEKILITDRLLKVIGYYLAEGSMGFHYNVDGTRKPHTVAFNLSGTKDRDIIDEITSFINEDIGYNVNYRSEVRNVDEQVTLEINGVNFCNFIKTFVNGDGAKNKSLRSWVMELPPEKQLLIYKGWFAGDGHSSSDEREIIITVSKLLAEQMTQILARNNINSYINLGTWQHRQNPNHSVQYRVNVPLNRKSTTKRCNTYISNGYIFRRVNKVEFRYDQLDVYNFSVEKEQSYIASMCGVHNCINRNQPRKAIPSLIYAFKLLKDGYVKCDKCGYYRNLGVIKDCELCGSYGYEEGKTGLGDKAFLYLHMNAVDLRGFRLPKIIRDVKLNNVIMMPNFDVANGVPVETLNLIYNASDVTVNPTAAGGYELTTAESLAAGRPTVGTRTTSIIEQLEDGRGYLVQPSAAIVMEDASHCMKHVIDINKLTDTLYHIHDNPEEAASKAEAAIAFSKERNWDKSAKQFEELFDKALASRVSVADFVEKDKKNVLIINETDNFAHVLAMVPYLSKLIADKTVNYIFSFKTRILPLLKGIEGLNLIPYEYLWLSSTELQGIQLEVHGIDGAIVKHEGAHKFVHSDELPSWTEIYKNVFLGLEIDFKQIYNFYGLLDEEEVFADKAILEEDKKNFKVAFIMDTGNINSAIEIGTYAQVVKFLKQFDDISTYGIGPLSETEKADTKYKISDVTLREIIAILSKMNCIVTNVEEYAYLANVLNVPFVIIQGTRDLRHVVKHARAKNVKNGKTLVSFADSKAKYQCMPCFKQPNANCQVWNSPRAHCMVTLSAGTIFAKIVNIRDVFKSS